MEENNVKIFWKPVDGGELKELECVAESDGFDFEPLKEPIDVKYDPTPVTHSLSFDIDASKCNIRKLLYTRVPRKKKKWQKKQVAMIDGKPVTSTASVNAKEVNFKHRNNKIIMQELTCET